jgi:hypothetical protein
MLQTAWIYQKNTFTLAQIAVHKYSLYIHTITLVIHGYRFDIGLKMTTGL